jgi:hypothetical protein
MTEADTSNAYKALGLDEKASQVDVEQAYKRQLAFYTAAEETGSVSSLAAAMRAQLDASYKTLSKNVAPNESTISGAKIKKVTAFENKKGTGHWWVVLQLPFVGGFTRCRTKNIMNTHLRQYQLLVLDPLK